jgi:hypothetical protein
MITELITVPPTPQEVMQQLVDSANVYVAELSNMKIHINNVDATKINLKRCKSAADNHADMLVTNNAILKMLAIR